MEAIRHEVDPQDAAIIFPANMGTMPILFLKWPKAVDMDQEAPWNVRVASAVYGWLLDNPEVMIAALDEMRSEIQEEGGMEA